jgi:hypothetical protein
LHFAAVVVYQQPKPWVRIQKPVVTYDPGKSSVTSSARLPNYIKIKL